MSGEVTEPYGMSEGTEASWNINGRGGSYVSSSWAYCLPNMRRLNHERSTKSGTLRLWMYAE